MRIVHLIHLWHHPRTRCLRIVAVVRIAAQNALKEMAPNYLKLNASVPKVPHAELLPTPLDPLMIFFPMIKRPFFFQHQRILRQRTHMML